MNRNIDRRCVVAGLVLLLLVWTVLPVFAQTVAAPTVEPLKSYKGLLRSPAGLAVDSSGRVYITDPPAGRVFVRDMYGRLAYVKDGLQNPLGVAIGLSGIIYVAEEGAGRVTIFDSTWNPIGKLGIGDNEFKMPNHIAVDAGIGNVYVTDSRAGCVKVYSADGTYAFTFGAPGTAAGQFNFPTGIFVSPAREVFVGDQNNDNRIQVFGLAGTYLRSVLGGGILGRIQGIMGDAAGRIFVSDTFQGYVLVTDRMGTIVSTVGSFGEGPGELRNPTGLTMDSNNRLFVGSVGNSRVEVFGLNDYSNPSMIQAMVDIRPTRGYKRTVSVFIEVPGASPDQISVPSVTANGVHAIARDYDQDGVLELQVRFDVNALLSTLADGEALINIDGQLRDGRPFEGSAILAVLTRQR
jgi:hypothetical protein